MLNVPSLISKTIQFLIAFSILHTATKNWMVGRPGNKAITYHTGPINSPNIWFAKKCAIEMLENLHEHAVNLFDALISAWELYSKPCACMLILLVPVRFV